MQTDRPTWRSRAWLVAAGVLAVLVLTLTTVGFDSRVSVWMTVGVSAGVSIAVIAWALARTRSQRRRYEDELAAWAADRAAQAERLRIARDLHDLASHGLGLITVRAAAARALAGPEGEAERSNALADIEDASRRTTTELRRMLAVLRTPGPAPLRPADTIDDLPAIVKAAADAGLTVVLDTEPLGELSPGAQLTVCAIVRGALNNTVRHAGPTDARVEARRHGNGVVVEVEDAGPRHGWHARPGAGHGLDGLRERVAALDGSLDAGLAGHGWLLTARIPDRDAR